MVSHLNYLDALTRFHKSLREGFYTKIFDTKTAKSVNWENHEAKFYEVNQKVNWTYIILPTLLITLLIIFLGAINLRKI